MSIFNSLQLYAGNWQVKNSRNFTTEEQSEVLRAQVVDSGQGYGLSCCFFMKAGGQVYIPMSTKSKLSAGDAVDVATCKVLTLSRQGDNDIVRIEE
jgi:hypothetical protein